MNLENNEPTSWLERPISTWLPLLNFRNILIALILILAVASRFYNVDLRVMSHDEVNHVVPSFDLFSGRGYRHDPVTHGPMQFHLVALSYFMLGDNDFSSRLPSVLFSIATVAFVIFGYRRYLGKNGAIIGGFLFLISPFMLFYGRYTRNESFVAFFGVVMIYAILNYLEKGRKGTLLLLTAVLSLHFCTKETSFIYAAQLLLFLAFVLIREAVNERVLDPAVKKRFVILMTISLVLIMAMVILAAWVAGMAPQPLETANGTDPAATAQPMEQWEILTLSAGLLGALAAGALGIVLLIKELGWEKIRSYRSFDLLILVGTLILPQLTAFPIKMIGWDPLDYSSIGLVRTSIFLVILLVISAVIGILWRPRTWLINAGLFYGIYVILYTTFFTNGRGFFTGIVGSLGYWLSQQGVQRGSQPFYYFGLIQIPIYEYLAAFGTLLALYFGIRYSRFVTWPGSSQVVDEIPAGLNSQPALPESEHLEAEIEVTQDDEEGRMKGPLPILVFLLFWSATALLAYSVAGEKMPWLTVHIALPLLLSAGWGLGYLLDSTPWKRIANQKGVVAVLLVPVFFTSLAGVLGGLLGSTPPFRGNELAQLEATNTFIMSVVAMIASGYGIFRLLKDFKGFEITRLFLVVFAAILSVLTIRASAFASYVNYDNATEFLVYAHASAAPKQVLAQVEEISRRTAGGLNVQVAYDNDALYPYWWYFRNYPNHRWFTDKPTRDLREFPLIISGDANYTKLDAIVKDNFVVYDYIRLWWPMQDYFNLTWDRIWGAISNPEMRAALFDIWLNRDYSEYARITNNQSLTLENWQPSGRMRLYIRKDIVSQIWNYGAAPAAQAQVEEDPYLAGMKSFSPDLAIGTTGSQAGQLLKPRGIAVAPDGTIYVADSGNHRIQHIAPDGKVLHIWGRFADTVAGDAPGGTFNEPWGVALGKDGSVYVTDTWNHRVQKFTADGTFVKMWGIFGQAETADAFWGPRGMAVDSQGRVFVTDTGNKRVVVFSPDGDFITQFGSTGMDLGQFDEPVGIAIGSDDLVYVNDTWNQRIQVFQDDASGAVFTPINSWDVSAWFGQSLDNKPFIAVEPDGNILITDPDGYRVLEFKPDGTFVQGWGDYSTEMDGFGLPAAPAVDSEGRVWISDAGNNRLMRFVLP
jgi:DNA-binding beta-propeller fold protein YncE/4-amino-4-deoxy-L-arabinose transferase-like glycosyltransferase